MGFDVACIDHKPFKIRIIDQLFQKLFPYPFIAPAAEAAMGIFPISIIRRQVAPGRPSAQYPENSVEEPAIVSGDTAPLTGLSWKMSREQFPGMIAQIMAVICVCTNTHKTSAHI